MGFRFRKTVKVLPGVRLNVTKNGISSTSLGKRGATINWGKKGMSETIGIPGTGLSYRTDKNTPPWLVVVIMIAMLVILAFGNQLGLK